MNNLALRLLKTREALGYSQAQLAKIANEQQQYIQKLEKGLSRTLNPTKLVKIAKALDVDPGWLLFGTGCSPSFLADIVPSGSIPIITWDECKKLFLHPEIKITNGSHKYLPYMMRHGDQSETRYALPIGPDQDKPITYIILDMKAHANVGDYIVAYSKLWGAVSYAFLGIHNEKKYIMAPPSIGISTEGYVSQEAIELTEDTQIVSKVIAHISISE